MRTFTLLFPVVLTSFLACSDDGLIPVSNPQSAVDGGQASNDGGAEVKQTIELSGDISSSQTLSASNAYLLKGLVQVKAGVTLTIEKGTTLRGDSATKAILLIEPGAKILAQGTVDEPIVFTSQAAEGVRRPGDWGGLVILGRAPVNLPGGRGSVEGILKTVKGTEFGGDDVNDDSGVLSYVRVEYAGVVLSQDNEVNGITFGGVGRKTKVDHVQVRKALDDCFEFFGGTVDAKYLACQHNEDDGFDFDNGFQGRLQFLVLQQSPNHAGEDNGIESDNDAQGSANTPLTNPQVYNATLIGKNKSVDAVQYGLLLRRNSRGTYRNLVVEGFEAGIDIRDAATVQGTLKDAAPGLTLLGSVFWNSTGVGVVEHVAFLETGAAAPDKDNDGGFNEVEWFKAGLGNTISDPKLAGPFEAKGPGFAPATPLTSGAAAPPDDGFFDASAQFMGAFKDSTDSWASKGKWAVWSDE